MDRTYHLLHLAMLLLGSAVLFSCSGEYEEPEMTEPGYAKESMGLTWSRAGEESGQTDDKDDFKAWCDMTYFSATNQSNQRTMVFDGYRVCYSNTINWYYSNVTGAADQVLHYWNQDAVQYNFNAVSPYPDAAVGKLNKVSYVNYAINISDVIGNISIDASQAVDWLVASHCRYINSANFSKVTDEDLLAYDSYTGDHWYVEPDSYTDDVTLRFHHILSMLDFRFYKEDGAEAAITSVSVALPSGSTIYSTGSYTTASPHWSDPSGFTSTISNISDCNITVAEWDAQKVIAPKAIATQVLQLLEIPQTVKGKTCRVTITTADGHTMSGEFEFKTDWEEGKRYIHYFEIPKTINEIILVDIEVDDFMQGEPINVEDPVVNW